MSNLAVTQKKVCLLGELSVGKTSMVRRFVEGVFSDAYLSTIGTKVSRKRISLTVAEKEVRVSMVVWDLAGGENFRSLMKSYYRGASGAFVVCDISRSRTLEMIPGYVEDFRKVNPDADMILLANKMDLEEQREISDEQLDATCKELGLIWIPTSALNGHNVENAFEQIGEKMMLRGLDDEASA